MPMRKTRHDKMREELTTFIATLQVKYADLIHDLPPMLEGRAEMIKETWRAQEREKRAAAREKTFRDEVAVEQATRHANGVIANGGKKL